RLPLTQSEVNLLGHSIEFRLYAEDPAGFLPSPGKITEFQWEECPGVRVDYGYEANSVITPFYDPMIAKCIIHGETRAMAVQRASKFFDHLQIKGIKTNAPLFKEILKDEDFKKGIYSTGFLTEK